MGTMKLYLVAIPLFDATMAVGAYRLCDRSAESALDVRADFRGWREAMLSPGLDMVQSLGVEPFTGDAPLLIDLTRLHLLADMPARLEACRDSVVFVLPADLPPEPEVIQRIGGFMDSGYHFAMDGFPADGAENQVLFFAEYLILDKKQPGFTQQMREANRELRDKRLIITNVPDMETFHMLGSRNKALLTGDFYVLPVTVGAQRISPLKVNTLELLRQINKKDFELSDVTRVISRDPALSVSLLRFINSKAMGLANRVDSIQSAVTILGQAETRKWATVAASVSLADDRPSEITKLSMVRAKFAENLAEAFHKPALKNSLFLAGLFSLLDIMVGKPMKEAIKEVAVDDMVRQALVDKSGPLYPILNLIYHYEHADWDMVSILTIQNDAQPEDVCGSFIDALTWYRDLLQSMRAQDDAEPEETSTVELA